MRARAARRLPAARGAAYAAAIRRHAADDNAEEAIAAPTANTDANAACSAASGEPSPARNTHGAGPAPGVMAAIWAALGAMEEDLRVGVPAVDLPGAEGAYAAALKACRQRAHERWPDALRVWRCARAHRPRETERAVRSLPSGSG